MKVRDDVFYRNIVVRYVRGAYLLRLFSTEKAKEVQNILFDLELEFDDSIPGDALFIDNKIVLNRKRVFSNNDYDLIFFHEFTHKINCIHNDMYSDNGVFSKFKDYYCSRYNTDFNYNGRLLKKGHSCNPYTYFNFGLLLIDEVISEFVANIIYCQNKGIDMNTYDFSRNIGSNVLKYSSHFSYYGIGEKLVELFTKTLFLPNNEKNLKGLSKRLMDKNYCYEIIYQHFESDTAIRGLFEELCYMGVIAFYEEKYHGHLKDRYDIPLDLVYYSYNKCRDSLINGFENREVIPCGIVKPYFLK